METRELLKVKILNQALVHVPFEGWSPQVLEKAAQDLDLEASSGWRLFPNGPQDAISLWSHLLDQQMLASLPPAETLRTTERVTLAVKTRLSLLLPQREAARVTTQYLRSPSHLPQAGRLIYQTVNEIWYYAGDKSTDYNFYTKRGLLIWVYTRTLLYWLKDTSKDFEKTWAFLDNRIAEVLALPKYFKFPWKRRG